MFMQPKRGGLFGARPPWATPGIGDGHQEQMGLPPMGAPGLGLSMEAQQPRKMGLGTKLFGQGWEDKAFAIGGLLQGDGGAAFEKMQERRTAPLIEQAKRQAEYEDFVRKEEFRLNNKPPVKTAMQQNYEWLLANDPKAAKAYIKRQTDPIQWITGNDGIARPYSVGAAPDEDAPDTLPPDFDFGGGGVSNGTSGFR